MTISQHRIKSITIRFNHEIKPRELPQFRGAIIANIEKQDAVLFHNHKEDGLRYRYPLIQYKRLEKKAGILCLGEGTEAIGAFFANANFDIRIGDEHIHLEVDNIKADQVLIQAWDDMFDYHRRWTL